VRVRYGRPPESQRSAMKCHSPAPSLGHSAVGSTQEPAIQFAMMKCCLSATPDIEGTSSDEAATRSLSKRSHLGGRECQLSLQAEAYFQPSPVARGCASTTAASKAQRPSLLSHRLPHTRPIRVSAMNCVSHSINGRSRPGAVVAPAVQCLVAEIL
jgi:hypothetical protein